MEILVATKKTKIYKLTSVANVNHLRKSERGVRSTKNSASVRKNYTANNFLINFSYFHARDIYVASEMFVGEKRDGFSTVKFQFKPAAQYFRVHVPHIDLLEPRGLSLRRVHSTPGCSFGGGCNDQRRSQKLNTVQLQPR